jgi:hypothetical protein
MLAWLGEKLGEPKRTPGRPGRKMGARFLGLGELGGPRNCCLGGAPTLRARPGVSPRMRSPGRKNTSEYSMNMLAGRCSGWYGRRYHRESLMNDANMSRGAGTLALFSARVYSVRCSVPADRLSLPYMNAPPPTPASPVPLSTPPGGESAGPPFFLSDRSPEREQTDDCPAIGVRGVHSQEWYDGERCEWCGARDSTLAAPTEQASVAAQARHRG